MGGAWVVDRSWMPLPTRPQRYCDPATLVSLLLTASFLTRFFCLSKKSVYFSFSLIVFPMRLMFLVEPEPLGILLKGAWQCSVVRVKRQFLSKTRSCIILLLANRSLIQKGNLHTEVLCLNIVKCLSG